MSKPKIEMTNTLLKLVLLLTSGLWLSCGLTNLKDSSSSYDFKLPERVVNWTPTAYEISKTGDSLVTSFTNPHSSESFHVGYFLDGTLEIIKHRRANGYHSFIHKSAQSDQWMYMDFDYLNGGELPIRNCVTNKADMIIPDEITCFWIVNQIDSDSIRIDAIHPLADSINLYVSTRPDIDSVHSFKARDINRGLFQHSMKLNKEDTVVGFFRFFKPVDHETKLEWSKASYAVHTTFFKYPNDYVFDTVENSDGSFSIIRKGIYAD